MASWVAERPIGQIGLYESRLVQGTIKAIHEEPFDSIKRFRPILQVLRIKDITPLGSPDHQRMHLVLSDSKHTCLIALDPDLNTLLDSLDIRVSSLVRLEQYGWTYYANSARALVCKLLVPIDVLSGQVGRPTPYVRPQGLEDRKIMIAESLLQSRQALVHIKEVEVEKKTIEQVFVGPTCVICQTEPMNLPEVTKCGHMFCRECIRTALGLARNKFSMERSHCPVCREPANSSSLRRVYL